MNLGRLAGLVIFVLVFSLASHSLTNSAFAEERMLNDKTKITIGADYYKTNYKVAKDPSIEAKVKEAKEKLQAEIKHLKEMANSKFRGYLEKSADLANTAKTKVDIKAAGDTHKTNVKLPADKTKKSSS